MRYIEALLLLAVVAGIAWAIIALLRPSAGSPRLSGPRWTARCVGGAEGEDAVVQLEKPGEPALLIERIPARAPDFDEKLHEAMAEARMRASALNSEQDS